MSKIDQPLSSTIENEMVEYQEAIKKFRMGSIGDIKMQKIRLQLGTYAQRQDGVQMQRIKFPGGCLSANQLAKLADVADEYAGAFIHFTTRQDAQLYYIQLEKCPNMMRELAKAGITTREACGNTVRNITAGYRGGISPTEPFDATPYSEALYEFLVRNKYNQIMGRKIKIAFESDENDLSGMLIHDMGFKSVIKDTADGPRRGFRVYLGGGLGGIPMLGKLYTEFLPQEELMNLAAATVRLFDRYGNRKNRMQARMKFLVQTMGWEAFKKALDEERTKVKLPAATNDYLKTINMENQEPSLPENLPANPEGLENNTLFVTWRRDNTTAHKFKNYAGVHIRLKLGDLTSDKARELAKIAEVFSKSELRITIQQNLFFPWVPVASLPALYQALSVLGLADAGAETMADTTTCPGADTCRLGITSAKGLGAAVSEGLDKGLTAHADLTRDIQIKVSGCPNGCAQHGVSQIGFQGAALKVNGKTVPAHELFIGGQLALDDTRVGERFGKFPAKNGPKVVDALVDLYAKEKREKESFNDCLERVGKDRIKELLKPLAEVPSFEDAPEFYQDWGHENEKFVTRGGVKGECAGAPVQEKVPVIQDAEERLKQAEAFLVHQEFSNAQADAYEVAALAVRVPLYRDFVDPFTSEQSIWEFENIYARAGKVDAEWIDFADKFEKQRDGIASKEVASDMIARSAKLLELCRNLSITQ